MGLTTLLWIVAAVATVAMVTGLALERRLLWKPMLVLLVLAICAAGLSPHRDEDGNWRTGLKAGLDLAGGTSLIYKVQVPKDQDPNQVIPAVITTLQQRVDPQGVRNLTWRQESGDRIEIQMPRPREEVFERREALQDFEAALEARNLTPGVIRELEQAADDPAAYRALASDVIEARNVGEAREPLLESFREAVVELNEATEAYEAARGAPERRRELAGPVADARIAADDLREKLLATNLRVPDLRRAMSRPDKATAEEELTPRQRALGSLRQSHPSRVADIERYVELHNRYEEVRGPLDDPEDLKRLLRGAGVLEFRITANSNDSVGDVDALREKLNKQGPDSFRNERFTWVKIDDPTMFADTVSDRQQLRQQPADYLGARGYIGAGYGGEPYILCWNTVEMSLTKRPAQGDWGVASVSATADENFFPAVSFTLNPIGARWMSKLTGPNIGRNMAMILDGELLSAPRINSQLSSDVLITGGQAGFSQREQAYLVNTLRAGSLQAELSPEPIAESTIGPSLGRDNLRQGLESARDALIAVGLFMIAYYLFSGGVTAVALLSNIVIILGVMAAYQAAFTLPGIAGIVLTIGMCVDANVLIFERIREELIRGSDTETALRLGYQRAFSSIIDSNLTNLIVCIILYNTATTEVQGFAVTLGIGIIATLFTSLFMTRVIFMLWTRFVGTGLVRKQLPTVVPAIDKLLTPGVRWIAKRPLFFSVSAVLVLASWFGVYSRGVELLDIEFRAGTAVTFELSENQTMSLAEARERAARVAELADADPEALSGDEARRADRLRDWVADRRTTLLEERIEEAKLEADDESDVNAEALAAEVAEQTDVGRLSDATVVSVGSPVETTAAAGVGAGEAATHFTAFSLSTTLEDARTVSEAVKLAFDDMLDEQPELTFSERTIDDPLDVPAQASPVRPVEGRDLTATLGQPVDLAGESFAGGAAFILNDIQPAVRLDDVADRLKAMRLQPDFEDLGARRPRVVGLDTAPGSVERFSRIAILVKDPEINYFDDRSAWGSMVQREWQLINAALTQSSSLARVSNFTPTVAETLKDRAIIAVLLSLAAIIAYIWFRFGSFRYGLAAIAALVHDVSIALGALVVSHALFTTAFGQALLIGQFKINTGLIAALLTIIGYSLNDTIVLFDRIRENRGKLAIASTSVIDRSINQTISRTLLTSLTTLLAVGMMYIFGGEGIRGFAYALLIGVVVGTYSSIAIAAPFLALGGGRDGGLPEPESTPTGEVADRAAPVGSV